MTEAERLSESLCRMDTFTEHQRAEILKAASELCRLAAVEAELEALKKAISDAQPVAYVSRIGTPSISWQHRDIALLPRGTLLYTLKGIK